MSGLQLHAKAYAFYVLTSSFPYPGILQHLLAPVGPGSLMQIQEYDSSPSARALALHLYYLLSLGLTM